MISVKHKDNCCGCEACVQICPQKCISFGEDGEGFRYPQVDVSRCVQCGLCEKACPMLHQPLLTTSPTPFCYQNPDVEVLSKSSSGGLFTALADRFVDDNGIVVGARFDEHWEVVHSCVSTKEDLWALCTSKYVQSRMGDIYHEVSRRLTEGRRVLFCGTPCQVAAVRQSCRKNLELLTCVDFVCHGVPSPLVWRKWLASVTNGREVAAVNFRSKEKGWHNYSLQITLADGEKLSYTIPESTFTRAFSANIILRPSCYRCKMRGLHRLSDVTMADFWGMGQLLGRDDDDGVSLAFANTETGNSLLDAVGAERLNASASHWVRFNHSYDCQTPTTALRGVFFSRLAARPESFSALLESLTHLSPMRRRYYKIRTFVNKLFGII